MFNRIGYQITGMLAIDALLKCKEMQMGKDKLKCKQTLSFLASMGNYIKNKEKLSRSFENARLSQDPNILLKKAIQAPLNMNLLLAWVSAL